MARAQRRHSILVAWVTLACSAALVTGCSEESPAPKLPAAGYDIDADPFADLQAVVVEATRSDRRILLEIGGDWCIWCHHWERFLADHDDVRQVLDERFVVLKVNHSPENENTEFLSQFPEIPGYPHFFVLDAKGELLLSQGTAVLEQGEDGYDRQKALAFLRQWDEHGHGD